MKVFPRDYKRVVKAMKAKEIAAREEADLSDTDAFEELKKLATAARKANAPPQNGTPTTATTVPGKLFQLGTIFFQHDSLIVDDLTVCLNFLEFFCSVIWVAFCRLVMRFFAIAGSYKETKTNKDKKCSKEWWVCQVRA
jgi:hypothetical protein